MNSPAQKKRQLLIIPIIHAKEDFGTRWDPAKFSPTYESAVTKYWDQITGYIAGLAIHPGNIQIYQDSLPTGKDTITRDIVDNSMSPNYILLRLLENDGAKIIPSEDPQLLLEYMKLYDDALEKAHIGKIDGREIMQKRDKFIGSIINSTLEPGKLGILFIGARHHIVQFWAEDINAIESTFINEALIEAERETGMFTMKNKEKE